MLLLYPNEVTTSGRVHLTGNRAACVAESHRLIAGVTVSAGVLGRGRGRATILEVGEASITLDYIETDPALPREPITLIVGLSRPQTVKKVLGVSAMMGVERLCFVAADKSEKSYLQSTALFPDAIDLELIKGLEQSGDTVKPLVSIFETFHAAVNEVVKTFPTESLRVVGDSRSYDTVNPRLISGHSRGPGGYLLAVGPEKGWSDHEVDVFSKHGFYHVSLGERILRVEVALVALITQIKFLCALKEHNL